MNYVKTNFFLVLFFLFLNSCSNLPSEPTHTNSLGMEFVRIEPGTFTMGEASAPLEDELVWPLSYPQTEELVRRFTHGDPTRFDVNLGHVRHGDFDEQPAHQVTISEPFYMGVLEVTNALYEQFDPSHRSLRGKNGFSKKDDEAVVFVSWDEAVAFCEWLSEKEGMPYRLPTEAEWEYACRAGTQTAYSTGATLPEEFHKNARRTSFNEEIDIVPVTVGQTSPNPWGLQDMHGNVDEWTRDWYGPYEPGPQKDPVGRSEGDFRVTRGGSHGTNLYYLRSANRSGTLPENKNWLIGFRVVIGDPPDSAPLPPQGPQPFQENVKQEIPEDLEQGPEEPYFKGPRKYVKIPEGSQGPVYFHHNHDAAIVDSPNGDLLAIWYTCVEERGREVAVAASRLRYGVEEWEPASLFWDTPDRNDHCPALWNDGQGTLYHFNGLGVAGKWEPLAIVMRTSDDNGVSWSKADLIMPEHGFRQMVGEPVFRMQDGSIAFGADAGGGSTIWVSGDEGKTWSDAGGTINGIHAGIVPLNDGRIMALGRGMNFEGMMPKSISSDRGKTWTVSGSPFPPLGGGQRPVLIRLKEGPLFFASFARDVYDAKPPGRGERGVTKLFGAVSYDEGETWPDRRIITDGLPDHRVETIDGGPIRMSPTSSEPQGYLSVCQSVDGVIQLISSTNHYAFNLAWLKESVPNPGKWPKSRTLDGRQNLATTFIPTALPGESQWNFLGEPDHESLVGRVVGANRLRIRPSRDAVARWSNERLDGISGENLQNGITAELSTQITRSGRDQGVDLELFVRGGALTVNHYKIVITASGVYYWYDGQYVPIATGLNNAGAMHTYRLAVRDDTAVQIYRDGKLLSVQPFDLIIDWRAPARGSYLAWGAADRTTRALVGHVAFDISGAYQ